MLNKTIIYKIYFLNKHSKTTFVENFKLKTNTMKKILLSLATLALSNFAISQDDIVITEIMYNNIGADSLEFIELYNNGNSSVDLTGWSFSQGVSYTFPSTSVSAGEYLIVSLDSSAIRNTFNVASHQWTSGALSNSGESIVLVNANGDVKDSVKYDDGAPWPTTPDGDGPSLTLCDYSSDNSNVTNWYASGVSTGIIILQNEVKCSPLAADNVVCTTNPIIAFESISTMVNENVGTVTINLTITNESSMVTSADVIVGTASTANSADYTFTDPTTVTFPANSTTIQSFDVVINDDSNPEATEEIILEIQNLTNNAVAGSNSTHKIIIYDNDEISLANCSELFFSEYIEGSSNNKALEIYNPTQQNIDLSNYTIYRYNNGDVMPTDTLMLSGTINSEDVYVIAGAYADSANIRAKSDTLNDICYFNGNDALALYNNNSIVDVIGLVGENPGESWSVDTGSTKNYTLVRKQSVLKGTNLWTNVGSTQWTAYSKNDFSFIGSHVKDACSTTSINENSLDNITIYPNPTNDGVVYIKNIKINTSITVYNIIGSVVYSVENNNSNKLNLSHLNKGSYIITFKNNNTSIAKKIIIE